MEPTINDIQETLNRLYHTDSIRYTNYLAGIKRVGYRVFRNSNGIHKVTILGENTDVVTYLKKMFGMEDWSEQRF